VPRHTRDTIRLHPSHSYITTEQGVNTTSSVRLYLPLLSHPAHKAKQAGWGGQYQRGCVTDNHVSYIEYKYFPVEEIFVQVYVKMASITQQAAEEFLRKLLAEMSLEDEQYLMQRLAENAPALPMTGECSEISLELSRSLPEVKCGIDNRLVSGEVKVLVQWLGKNSQRAPPRPEVCHFL